MVLDVPGGLFPKVILDDSGVPLSDWKAIIDSGTLILNDGQAANATVTIYTVPAGKVFYFVSANVSCYTTADVDKEARLQDESGNDIFRVQASGDNAYNTASTSFAIPLKFIAAQAIKLVSDNANLVGIASISGYEVNA